jgi:uncharacterized membrane protein YkgB
MDTRPAARIESIALRIGPQFTRYAIVALLFIFGGMKWTAAEASGIQPFVSHSPFFGWLYGPLSVQGVSIVFGIFEVAAGLAIALRPVFPMVSAAGSAFTVVMFLTTLSFLVTTPGLAASPEAGFVMKDIVLLGGAIWTLGEALTAVRRRGESHASGVARAARA